MAAEKTLQELFFEQIDKARTVPAGTINGKPVKAGELSALEVVEVRHEILNWRSENQWKPDPFADARMVVRSIMGEDNSLVFDREFTTIKRLMGMPDHVLEPLVKATNKANKAGPEETEELKKNSETQTPDSSTASPETPATST